MTNEQQLILWIIITTVAAFGAGCSLGSSFRSKNPISKGKASNARRK